MAETNNDPILEIGQRIKGLGQTVGGKAKEVSEAARIKAAIADKENARNASYQRLGAAWYAMHAADAPEDLRPYVGEIDEACRSIDELQEQLKTLQNKKACPVCGKMIPKDARFCQYCGTDTGAPVMSGPACPSCGKPYIEGDRFCQYCGASLEMGKEPTQVPSAQEAEMAAVSVAPVAVSNAVSETASDSQQIASSDMAKAEADKEANHETTPAPDPARCTSCGYVNPVGSRFCRKCGKPLV